MKSYRLWTLKLAEDELIKMLLDRQNLLWANIYNNLYKKKIGLSMETYLGMDMNICEVRQCTWFVNQTWKLIHRLAM